MDVSLARTFLIVAETGSFIEAGRKMNITQSTVSARIKGLEDLLGRPLFTRSKSGAELTGAGELFQKHALAMVRVWSSGAASGVARRQTSRPYFCGSALEPVDRFPLEVGFGAAN